MAGGMLEMARQGPANVGAARPPQPPVSPGQAAMGAGPPPPPPGKVPHPEGDEPATQAEQQEYERAANAISSIVYGENGGDEASNTIADGLMPEDKIGSLIHTGVSLIAEVDKQIDMDDIVVPQIVEDVTEMLVDVAQAKNGIEYTQEEMEAGVMGIWEGIMYVLGGDAEIEPDFALASQGLGKEDIEAMNQEYQTRLQNATGAQEQQQMSAVQGGGMVTGG